MVTERLEALGAVLPQMVKHGQCCIPELSGRAFGTEPPVDPTYRRADVIAQRVAVVAGCCIHCLVTHDLLVYQRNHFVLLMKEYRVTNAADEAPVDKPFGWRFTFPLLLGSTLNPINSR